MPNPTGLKNVFQNPKMAMVGKPSMPKPKMKPRMPVSSMKHPKLSAVANIFKKKKSGM